MFLLHNFKTFPQNIIKIAVWLLIKPCFSFCCRWSVTLMKTIAGEIWIRWASSQYDSARVYYSRHRPPWVPDGRPAHESDEAGCFGIEYVRAWRTEKSRHDGVAGFQIPGHARNDKRSSQDYSAFGSSASGADSAFGASSAFLARLRRVPFLAALGADARAASLKSTSSISAISAASP